MNEMCKHGRVVGSMVCLDCPSGTAEDWADEIMGRDTDCYIKRLNTDYGMGKKKPRDLAIRWVEEIASELGWQSTAEVMLDILLGILDEAKKINSCEGRKEVPKVQGDST